MIDFDNIGDELRGADVSRLVGRTIVKAEREPPSGKSWGLWEESLTIVLDDGSEWTFIGDGYDASSLEIYVKNGTA